jgi:DNA-binding NarL/FixJ family response regulator
VSQLKVFLVDDHAMIRSGVRAELGADPEASLAVVGEAGTVEDAVRGILTTMPDVVLLDVHMPNGGGRAVLDQVRGQAPGVRFLALSVSDAAEDVIGVIRSGARGYVTKTISGADLRDAVSRVAAGDAIFSPRLLRPRRVRQRSVGGFRGRGGKGAGPAQRSGARGDAPAGPRVHLPGDRPTIVHLDQDRGDTRLQCAAQAAGV